MGCLTFSALSSSHWLHELFCPVCFDHTVDRTSTPGAFVSFRRRTNDRLTCVGAHEFEQLRLRDGGGGSAGRALRLLPRCAPLLALHEAPEAPEVQRRLEPQWRPRRILIPRAVGCSEQSFRSKSGGSTAP